MRKFNARITKITILPEGTPIFGVEAIHVTVADEAAGEYISIEQITEQSDNKIGFEKEAWPLLKKAIQTIVDDSNKFGEYDKEQKQLDINI